MFQLFRDTFRDALIGFREIGMQQSQTLNTQAIKNVQRNCLENLPKDIFSYICSFLSAEALSTVRCVNRRWKELASADFLWDSLLQSLGARVRNLDNKNLRGFGFPQVNPPTINPRKLLIAAKIACNASENGSATILTIPKGWSWDDLEKLSMEAVNKGTPSAEIFINDELKALLRRTPIKEEQTVIVTDTVIHDSCYKSIKEQEKCLVSNGFAKELPDALTILTTAVMTRIFTKGQTSLYSWEHKTTWTSCAQKMTSGHHLCVGSASPGVHVYCVYPNRGIIGVGGVIRV